MRHFIHSVGFAREHRASSGRERLAFLERGFSRGYRHEVVSGRLSLSLDISARYRLDVFSPLEHLISFIFRVVTSLLFLYDFLTRWLFGIRLDFATSPLSLELALRPLRLV